MPSNNELNKSVDAQEQPPVSDIEQELAQLGPKSQLIGSVLFRVGRLHNSFDDLRDDEDIFGPRKN